LSLNATINKNEQGRWHTLKSANAIAQHALPLKIKKVATVISKVSAAFLSVNVTVQCTCCRQFCRWILGFEQEIAGRAA